MKNKIYILVGTFLLLVPFRLPISVLLINLFNYIANISTGELPIQVLRGNVLVSKAVYASFMAVMFQINVYNLIKQSNLKTKEDGYIPLVGFGGFLWLCYVCYDVYSTGLIFDMINK